MRLRFGFALLAALAGPAGGPRLLAQTAPNQTTVQLSPKLLPETFAGLRRASTAPTQTSALTLTAINKAALEEFNPQRSEVANFTGPKPLVLEAIEFNDATGAYGAYTLVRRPEMKETHDLGTHTALGVGTALWTSGTVLVLAYPVTSNDLSTLKVLDMVLPKASGNRALPPLLPTLLPERGLQPSTLRYALGPHSYQSEGGVLPSGNLGWDKSAEAITAGYTDRRGAETLTVFLYPTPAIAGPYARQFEAMFPTLGPSFQHARVRREGPLVILANGSFSVDSAQNLVENVHHKQLLTTDRSMPTPDAIETRKTYSTLAQTIIFSGVLGLATLLLGIFLGGGRALLRVLRGKPASTEAEFLSLHLDPQNPRIHPNK